MNYACIATLAIAAGTAIAQPVETFLIPIPEIGEVFLFDSGFIPGSADFAGGTVIDAQLNLTLRVDAAPPGSDFTSDASHFDARVVLPVDIDGGTPGAQLGVVDIIGANEGLSGIGTFNVSRQLDHIIGGTWEVPVLFTAETFFGISPTQQVVGTTFPFQLSFITVTVQAVPGPGALAGAGALGVVATRRRR